MIKLHIIDLVWCFGLEPLIHNSEFFICNIELEEIKDRPESSVGDESRVRFVFILEIRFDEKSSVFSLNTDSLQT